MLSTRSSWSTCRGVQPCRLALRQQLTRALRGPEKPGRLQQRKQALPAEHERTMVLPGGLWLLSEDGWLSMPVQGEGFIMQRGAAGNQGAEGGVALGLVPYTRPPTGMAVRRLEPGRLAEMAAALPLVTVPMLPNSTCTGIVPWVDPSLEEAGLSPAPNVEVAGPAQLHGLAMSCALAGQQQGLSPLGEHIGVFESHTHSPRRTKKVKFTCGRCGAINIKPINPHAYSEGSVFAKCANCTVTHKLIDNLKLFHELSGPVFEAPPPAGLDALLPERLRLRLPNAMEELDS